MLGLRKKPSAIKSILLIGLSVLLITNLAQASATNSIEKPRIITLAPHLAELVYSAGAGKYLVGVMQHSDYPVAVKSLPVVGNYQGINIEAILQLKPDLIIAWQDGNRPADLTKLKQLNIPLWETRIQQLEQIPELIEKIGDYAGSSSIAKRRSNELKTILQQTRKIYQSRAKSRAFYQLWHQPLITVNGQHFISQALATCHIENIFKDSKLSAPQVSIETLLKADPDMILIGGDNSYKTAWKQYWQKFSHLRGAQNLISINSDIMQRPSARLIESLPELCQRLTMQMF